MNIREPSTHLSRDKEERDYIEGILKDWGDWRARTEFALDTGSQSPIAGVIGENSGKLYGENKEKEHLAMIEKYAEIKIMLISQGFSDQTRSSRVELRAETSRILREWKERKKDLAQPKEDIVKKPKIPGYNGNHYYSKIDKIISGMNRVYRYILINKYENDWSVSQFMTHRKWEYQTTVNRISEARREFKNLLKKA